MSGVETVRSNRQLLHPWAWLLYGIFIVVGITARNSYNPLGFALWRIGFEVSLGAALIGILIFGPGRVVCLLISEFKPETSKTKRVLSIAAVLLLMCATLGFFMEGWLAMANAKFDSSPETCRDMGVMEKMHGKGGHNRLKVLSWREGEFGITFHVDSDTYKNVSPSMKITVCSRKGALGAEWISNWSIKR